jgi:2-methylisocitrate lyase-like PEP mutase family enzyme
MIAGGKTPFVSDRELGDLGFQIILHALDALFAAARAMEAALAAIRAGDQPCEPAVSFAEFGRIIGLEEKLGLAKRYGAE